MTPEMRLLRRAITMDVALAPLGSLIDTTRAKPAAVVVPVMLSPELSAVAVLRGSQLVDHPGEVAFPGGKPEPTDEDLAATALRELEEEVGVTRAEVELVGGLRPVPVITGRYLIHPFVGVLAEAARPRAMSSEIARVLTIPLLPLVRGERPIESTRGEWKGVTVFAPHIQLEGCVIYGASAYILYELLCRLAAALGVAMPEARADDTPPWGDRYTR